MRRGTVPAILILLALAAAPVLAKVKVQHDPEHDFSVHKTYAWKKGTVAGRPKYQERIVAERKNTVCVILGNRPDKSRSPICYRQDRQWSLWREPFERAVTEFFFRQQITDYRTLCVSAFLHRYTHHLADAGIGSIRSDQ